MPNNVVEKSGNLITLGASDVGQYVRIVEPGNVIITVDTFNPQLGDIIEVEHVSLARVVFDLGHGATIRLMDRFYAEILAIYGTATLKCVGTNEWNLSGALRPKPEWQMDVDSFPNLSYGLNPVVNIDWTAALAELEATLATVNSPGLPTITCTISYP